jgi:hypothetical protein
MWLSLAVAFLVALLFTLPIVWWMGWRRPGAPVEESAVLSGLFLFALVFLAAWALTGWLTPWGPAWSGVSWLLILIGAAFVALLVLVASPSPGYPAGGAPFGAHSGGDGPSVGPIGGRESSPRVGAGIEGIGLMFWMLILLLLVVGILGHTDLW